VCSDDVNRCDWLLEGTILLVSRRKDSIGAACFGVWWRFNNHQEVQYREEGSEKKGRNVGINIGIRSGRRGIRKFWERAPGAPKKGPKNLKNVFEQSIGKCVLKNLCSE